MSLMVGKRIRGGIWNAIHWYAIAANNKYIKEYDKNKESYLNYCVVNNVMDNVMLQKILVNNFEWIEEAS